MEEAEGDEKRRRVDASGAQASEGTAAQASEGTAKPFPEEQPSSSHEGAASSSSAAASVPRQPDGADEASRGNMEANTQDADDGFGDMDMPTASGDPLLQRRADDDVLVDAPAELGHGWSLDDALPRRVGPLVRRKLFQKMVRRSCSGLVRIPGAGRLLAPVSYPEVSLGTPMTLRGHQATGPPLVHGTCADNQVVE